jgi:hypothetical protein
MTVSHVTRQWRRKVCPFYALPSRGSECVCIDSIDWAWAHIKWRLASAALFSLHSYFLFSLAHWTTIYLMSSPCRGKRRKRNYFGIRVNREESPYNTLLVLGVCLAWSFIGVSIKTIILTEYGLEPVSYFFQLQRVLKVLSPSTLSTNFPP